MLYFTQFFRNVIYVDQCIPHVNDPYCTKNKGTSTVFLKITKALNKNQTCNLCPPLSALSCEALPAEMG